MPSLRTERLVLRCVALQIPQTLKAMRESQNAVGGDKSIVLHNMTASFAALCAVLSVVAACGVSAHRILVMTQVKKSDEMARWDHRAEGGGEGG